MLECGVSICCITYNQKKYIVDAIESFLCQKTNFDYEILIHDDCSTDNTLDILHNYMKKYPDKIRVIEEKENQWSKGNSAILQLVASYAKGKYIALCEGDDYWIDEYKLQKQFDKLESDKRLSCSFHDAQIVGIDGTVINQSMLKNKKGYKETSGIYSCEEIIDLDFYPTASIFYRSEYMQYSKLPKYFWNGFCGDLPTRLQLGSEGMAYCFNEQMSAYRIGNPNSASGQTIKNRQKIIDTMDAHIGVLKAFDLETSNKYHEAIEKKIIDKEIMKYRQLGDIVHLTDCRHRMRFRQLPFKTQVKCYLIHFFPWIRSYL